MKKLCIAYCFALLFYMSEALASEAGMPQLNTEYWASQIFWLILYNCLQSKIDFRQSRRLPHAQALC